MRLGCLLLGVLVAALGVMVLVWLLGPVRRVTGWEFYSLAGKRPLAGAPPPMGLSGVDLAPLSGHLNRLRVGPWVIQWRWSSWERRR